MNNEILNELIKKWENEYTPNNLTDDSELSKIKNAEYIGHRIALQCCIDDLKTLMEMFRNCES